MNTPEAKVQYFLQLEKTKRWLDGSTYRRWIEWKGFMIDKFFDCITIITLLDPEPRELHPAIGPLTHAEMLRLKPKLNSEIVKAEEPDLYANSPAWQEAYKKTHRNRDNR